MSHSPGKALFIIDRDNYYKFFSPVINELLQRRFEVYLAHNYQPPRFPPGEKHLSFASCFKTPQFSSQDKIHSRIVFDTRQLLDVIIQENVDFVFSLQSWTARGFSKSMLGDSKWVTLQHWGDNFTSERNNVINCDFLCLYSQLWWDGFIDSTYGRGIQEEGQKKSNIRVIYSGCPYHDKGYLLDHEETRKKYGISRGKKIILYMPLGLAGTLSDKRSVRFWVDNHYHRGFPPYSSIASSLYGRLNEWRVTESKLVHTLREFCDKEDALLILKGRVKKSVDPIIGEMADFLFYDESFFPSTVTELLSISDIFVSHFSMAVWEAINLGIYNINIALGPIADIQTALFRELFSHDWKADLTQEGLNEICSAETFLRDFGHRRMKEFEVNAELQKQLATKYFSIAPGKSTTHFVDNLLRA